MDLEKALACLPDAEADPTPWVEALRAHLRHDFSGLVAALYRFDLDEAQFRAAMKEPDPAAALLAALVQRDKQKQMYRQQYARYL